MIYMPWKLRTELVSSQKRCILLASIALSVIRLQARRFLLLTMNCTNNLSGENNNDLLTHTTQQAYKNKLREGDKYATAATISTMRWLSSRSRSDRPSQSYLHILSGMLPSPLSLKSQALERSLHHTVP